MSMVIDNEKSIVRFDVPNSEAIINAQHNGIANRCVGSYYLSELDDQAREFFNDFDGEFYVDIDLSVQNVENILLILKDKRYEKAFKSELVPQHNQIDALKWLKEEGEYFYKIENPQIHPTGKYFKFNNDNSFIAGFRTLILGDVVSIVFKKIGKNGFIIYLDKNPNFVKMLENKQFLKWMD